MGIGMMACVSVFEFFPVSVLACVLGECVQCGVQWFKKVPLLKCVMVY